MPTQDLVGRLLGVNYLLWFDSMQDLAQVVDQKKPKHVICLIRRKGSVPLSRGAKAAACKVDL